MAWARFETRPAGCRGKRRLAAAHHAGGPDAMAIEAVGAQSVSWDAERSWHEGDADARCGSDASTER
jgi:hypothetical protein